MAETKTKRVRMARTLAGPTRSYHAGREYELEAPLADALVADGRATEPTPDQSAELESERTAREAAEADVESERTAREAAEAEAAELRAKLEAAQAKAEQREGEDGPGDGPAGGAEKRG